MDIPSYLIGKKSGGGKGATIEVVTELPETGEANVIYLVPKQDTGDNDVFDEYVWVNNDWELIGSTAIDISGKQDVMQFSTMPNASADYVGKIVQYTGTTDSNYTNGYFYIGTTNGETTPTYGWVNINVQNLPDLSEYINMDEYISYAVNGPQIALNTNGSVSLNNGIAQNTFKNAINKRIDGEAFNIYLKDSYGNVVILFMPRIKKQYTSNVNYNVQFLYLQYPAYGKSVFYGGTRVILTFSSTTGLVLGATITGSNGYGTQELAYKKYVDDAIASAGSSVPTITITASQIVSQNPLQISMTAEQQAIIEDANVGTLIIDGSSLGVNPAYCQKNQNGSTDILIAAFSFAWNGTSGFSISNTTIFAGRYDKETHILHILDTPLLGNTPTADNHLANKKYVDDKSVQYETMPTASADYLGKIVQYTGTTNVNYTNGYFYECVGTTENNVTTYSWSNVEVQSGGNSAIPIYYLQLNGTGSSLELVETLEAIDKVNIAAIITDAYSKGFSNIEIYIRTSNNDSDHCIFTLTDTYSGNPANIQLKPGKMNFTTGIFKSNYFERYMLYLTLSWDGNIATVSAGTMSHSTLWYLTSNNTRVYTPTSDYNPATKKYVDDSIAAAITTTLGGSY